MSNPQNQVTNSMASEPASDGDGNAHLKSLRQRHQELRSENKSLAARASFLELQIDGLKAENGCLQLAASSEKRKFDTLASGKVDKSSLLEELNIRRLDENIPRRQAETPRIAYVTKIKNEEDKIYYHLNYYRFLGIRDFYIYNHGSTDGTKSLIEKFASENKDVSVVSVFDPSGGYYQSSRMTALADLAYAQGCDWILPLDADEILLSREGVPDLKSFCGQKMMLDLPYGLLQIPLVNYVPTSDDPPGEKNPFLRLRNLASDAPPEFVWTPKVLIKWRRGMYITQGNHGVVGLSHNIDIEENPFFLAHFPYTSQDHLVKKVIEGGRSFDAAPEVTAEASLGWRESYTEFKSKGAPALLEWFDYWRKAPRTLTFAPLEREWFLGG